MQLVLSTFGSGINKSGELFEIFSTEQKKKISPLKITSILIFPGVSISSDAVLLAHQNNIDILMLDKYGNPVGRFWHARMGSTARIRRAQLTLAESEAGLEFGLCWVQAKFENQIEFLKEMRTRRTRLSAEITTAINNLEAGLKKVGILSGSIEDIRHTVLGFEGTAGKSYWQIFSKFLPETYQFEGRSRQPAKDEFNALLNYGYGMLYGIIERSVIVAGLDPYIGFIHTDNYNKVSLVFDVIEKYRNWIDQTILGLFSKKAITKDLFKKLANGISLGDDGKKILIPAVNEFLDKSVLYKGKNSRRRDIIQLDLHNFAQKVLKSSKISS
jgi:CRISPR-associated protein Cas1